MELWDIIIVGLLLLTGVVFVISIINLRRTKTRRDEYKKRVEHIQKLEERLDDLERNMKRGDDQPTN